MSDKVDEKDEELETLPVGHPQAGYVSPDLSETDQAGTLPDKEKEWAEARDQAREDEVEAVAAHEDEVAKEEADEAEEAPAPAPTKAAPAKSSSSGSSAGSAS